MGEVGQCSELGPVVVMVCWHVHLLTRSSLMKYLTTGGLIPLMSVVRSQEQH
jgi:hypothetical protein